MNDKEWAENKVREICAGEAYRLDAAVGLMIYKQLKRIADALEKEAREE